MEYGQFCPVAKATEILGEKWTLPIIREIGDWGMRWACNHLTESDYDVELLMLYLQRSIVPEKLIGPETVLRFKFTDIDDLTDWWLLVKDKDVDICVSDPGKDVDVYFTTSVRVMAGIWMGDTTYKKAIAEGGLTVVGPKALTREITAWMGNSIFADIPSAGEI